MNSQTAATQQDQPAKPIKIESKSITKKKSPDKPKRKMGRPVGSITAGRNLKAFKVQEVINLSENILIKVLKGGSNLPHKTVVNIALELYKRRVPAKTESVEGGNKLTIIKIVKNHVPLKKVETIDIKTDDMDKATDAILKEVDIAAD